jgi:phthalate 4,5-cis-dihydrodiol dehydrogenase
MRAEAAIIGLGFVGKAHLEALRRLGIPVRGILGSSPERTREAAEELGISRAYSSLHELVSDSGITAVHICSPNQVHHDQSKAALEAGKHVMCEKPLALTLKDCDAVVAAAERTGMRLIVGHTHAFDPNVREMRWILDSGELGQLGMILSFNYNDFLFRPHRADEFDAEVGGGIAFNQLTHQIEIVRLLGGRIRAVRASVAALDRARGAAGHCTAFLDLESGAAASVTFSAYDFFDSDEWHHWIAEGGMPKPPNRHGATRTAFLVRTDEREAHRDLGYGGRTLLDEQPYLPHFGLLVVTCERGDMRLSPTGIVIHGLTGTREVAVPRGIGRPGQGDALDALWQAVREGQPSIHDARWGRDTVAAILAVLQSSRTRQEVLLA